MVGMVGVADKSWWERHSSFFIIAAAVSFSGRDRVEVRRRHADSNVVRLVDSARNGRFLEEVTSVARKRLCLKVILSRVVGAPGRASKLCDQLLLLVLAHLKLGFESLELTQI